MDIPSSKVHGEAFGFQLCRNKEKMQVRILGPGCPSPDEVCDGSYSRGCTRAPKADGSGHRPVHSEVPELLLLLNIPHLP